MYPTSAAILKTLATVNCHPRRDPRQAIHIIPITACPTVLLNIAAKARPKGAELSNISWAGRIPNMILVEIMYTTAQRKVPPSTATGTLFSGFLTFSQFAQADSIPRKDHSVIVIALVAASPKGRTFQLVAYISPEKKNQPTVQSVKIGRITPHMVNVPMRPVILAPPKLGNVVSHRIPVVAIQVVIGSKRIPRKVEP